MIKEVFLNEKKILYTLERKNVKNINLRIKPDQSICVSASEQIPISQIEKFIVSKSEYILKALERYAEIAKYSQKSKQYVDGESFKILGHNLRLRVIQGSKNQVSNDGSYITLTVKDLCDSELKKRTMNKWLKQQSKDILLSICESVYPKFQKYGIEFPQVRFRSMISRWGSCQPNRGILTFNISLIEVPLFCIEYVVVHEFTHFLHPNHSKKFYTQLAMFMPDWKDRKKILERNYLYKE